MKPSHYLRLTMRRCLCTAVLWCLAFGLALASAVLSRFEARTEGSDVVVSWQASVEDEVQAYVLERKTRFDVRFLELKRVAAKGVNQVYTYRDTQIYKTAGEQVQYRLRIVSRDQSFVVIEPISVDYTPTAIRRTWGSIKAMFQ